MVSPNWITSSYGLKIRKAKELQDEGHDTTITTEKLWLAHLADAGRA